MKCERLFGDRDCGAMWRTSVAAVNRHVADEGPGAMWYGRVHMDTGARTATTYGALHAFFPVVLAMGGDLDRARRLQKSSFRMRRRRVQHGGASPAPDVIAGRVPPSAR